MPNPTKQFIASEVAQPRHRFAELDGLRGIAIGMVIALHLIIRPNYAAWEQLLGGSITRLLDMTWAGVDIFFVLSGFLIGGIIIDNRASRNFYFAFYSRRTARIFPAYFLLLTLAFLPLGPLGVQANAGAVPFGAYATFTANLFTSAGHAPSYWLGPLWSISIEEQFYILAPLCMRLVPGVLTPWLLIAVVAASAALRTSWSLGLVEHSFSYWDFTLTRLDGLGLGVLAAWLVREPGFVHWAAARTRWLSWLLIGLIGLGAWFSQQPNRLLLGPGILALSLTAFVCILLLQINPATRMASVLRVRPLVALGRYSYFLYLFHMPVFWVVQAVLPRDSFAAAPVIAVSLMLVGTLAVISWRFLESPIIGLGRRIPYSNPG
jgi:peptidoglycan/LPS O-acetylase OafA/YrhL